MTNKTFEEQFQGLVGKETEVDNWNEMFTKKDINENCLDKQRVRDKISDMFCHQAPNVCECCKELENLKKELGL